MKKTCENCANVSTAVCDDCWTSDTIPHWKPASNYVPDTRIERLRSMSDGEIAIWFAKSQFDWTKNICADFGIEFNYNEDDIKEAAKEVLAWFLEFVEESNEKVLQ